MASAVTGGREPDLARVAIERGRIRLEQWAASAGRGGNRRLRASVALAKYVVEFTDAASRVLPHLTRGEGNHADATSREEARLHGLPSALFLRLVPVVPINLDCD